jgi:hypothetical protein
MRLIANKQLRYLGVTYKPANPETGEPADEFEAKGKWADLLQRAKLARRSVDADSAPRRGRPKGSTNKPKADAPEQPDPTHANETDQT